MEWICFFFQAHVTCTVVQLFNRLAMFSWGLWCRYLRWGGLFCWQQMDTWHLPVSLFDQWQIRFLGVVNTKRLIWYVYCLDLRLCSWWCPGFCYATAHYMPCASDNKDYRTSNFGRCSPTVLCWHFSMIEVKKRAKQHTTTTDHSQIMHPEQGAAFKYCMFLFSPRNLGEIDPIWLALRWGFNFKPPTRV